MEIESIVIFLMLILGLFVCLFQIRSNNKKLAAKEKKIAHNKSRLCEARRVAASKKEITHKEVLVCIEILNQGFLDGINDNIDNDYIPLKSSHLRGLDND